MTARVRVIDESGRSDTTEVTVEIDSQNLAPVADGGPYSTGPVGNSWLAVHGWAWFLDPNQPRMSWSRTSGMLMVMDAMAPMGVIMIPWVSSLTAISTQIGRSTRKTVRLIVCDGAGACS